MSINWLRKGPETNERLPEKSLKSRVTMMLAPLLAAGTIHAQDVKNLEQDLFQAWQDTYPSFLNIYWVWWKTKAGTYNWMWLKVHTDNFEAVAEKAENYSKVWAIGKIDFNENAYAKIGASYLELDDYKVGKYTIDPKQFSYGGALWYTYDSFNIEAGIIAHRLTWAKKANTTAYTKYLELVKRAYTDIGQFDFSWTVVNQKAYNKSKTYFETTWAYYPNEDIQLEATYNSNWNYRKDDTRIMAWIKYTFGWWKKWKFTPFVSWEYSANEHVKFKATYERKIANRPISWKDNFENYIFTNQIVAEQVAPNEFKNKVKESFNKEPIISSINWPSQVYAWDTATYSVQATDPDNDDITYTWRLDWKIVWHGSSVNVSFPETKTYKLKVTVSDGISSTSKTMTINSKEKVFPAPSLELSTSTETIITLWQVVTLTASVNTPDSHAYDVVWYKDWEKIKEWKLSITDKPTHTWSIDYSCVVTDKVTWKHITKHITIKVKQESHENQAPTVSISADKTTVKKWQNVTLTANASDPDGTVTKIEWFDAKTWKPLWKKWASITITENTVWTFNYYAKVTDNDGAVTESNHITINVEANYNASWQAPLQSELNTPWVWPWEISDASWKQVVINDLSSYVSNLPAWSTFRIVSISSNSARANWFSIEWNSLVRNWPDTWYPKETVTVTIQIVYPDGSLWPTNSWNFTIVNT